VHGASLERIATELDAYPPNNVLKHLTLKAYFGEHHGWLAERQELIDSSVVLAKTLSAQTGSRLKFPAFQSLDLFPVVSSYGQCPDVVDLQQMAAYSEDLEHVRMVLHAMDLPFSFNIMEPNWSESRSEDDCGMDRDDSRWLRSVMYDNIVGL